MIKRDAGGAFSISALLMISAGLILAGITLFTSLQTAAQKNFWNDERYEIITLCDLSYERIIAGKTNQANKSPLYFLFQKFSISQIASLDPHILIQVRLVSIIAALFICLIFFFFIHARLGFLFAMLITISTISQNIFYHYTAESRPYMLWILLFTLLVLTTLKMCLQSFDKSSYRDRILFSLSILAVTLVISFGVIQGTAALLTCMFCWYFIHDRPKSIRPSVSFVLLLFLLCVCIQAYYTFQGVQGSTPNIVESPYDVISQIQKGDMSLLKMPARLLLPKPGRDAYWGAYVSNILVLIGIGIPFLKWNKRRSLKGGDFFVFILSLVTISQVAAALGIGLLIAFLHYWFVQRLFLYLIVCHALLATTGTYFLLGLNKKILNPFMKGALVILFGLSLNWHWEYYSSINSAQSPKACQASPDSLDNARQELSPANFQDDIPKDHAYARLDYIVKRNQHLENCGGWIRDHHTKRVSLCRALMGEVIAAE